MRLIVVSGADETSAAGLSDLAASLNAVRGDINVATACLDHGMTAQTRERIASQFDAVVPSQWPFRPHAQFDRQSQARDSAVRPFLPDYFPGYDAYAWIDARHFVQDARALEILALACANGFAGVIPAIDRSYNHSQESVAKVYGRCRMAFGKEIAIQLMRGPYTTSGVVAASASSPLWKLWRIRFQAALDRWDGPMLCADAVLNHVVRAETFPHHRLPSLCDWQSHLALPHLYAASGVMVEPSYPFDPIHIVANSVERTDQLHTFSCRDGDNLTAPLSFNGIRTALAERSKQP